MKRVSLFLAIILAVNVSAENVKTVLKTATVFFTGAELTHTATVQLKAGENTVTLEELSPAIDINSLKINLSNNVVVAATEFSTDFLTEKKEIGRVKNLQDSVDVCKEEITKLGTFIKVNTNALTLLQKGIETNLSVNAKGITIAEVTQNLDYYNNKATAYSAAIAVAEKQRADLQKTLERLNAQIAQEKTKNGTRSGILKLSLVAPLVVNATVTVSYYTKSASWTPYYDMNIASTDKPVVLQTRAKVRQTTGLDWDKVKLTLSTAQPSRGKDAPLFSTWFLNYVTIQPRVQNKEEVAKIAFAYDEEQIESEGIEDYVITEGKQISEEYKINLPYTIPGSGKEQIIDLKKNELKANYKYYCAPKLDENVYLIAEFTDWETLNLLSGQANITYDGTFVGQTYLNTQSAQKLLSVTLGTDKRITVKREKLVDYSSVKTFGSDTKVALTYKITAKNNQNKPISLVLKEQYPVSSQKDIEVELLKKETTTPAVNKEETGVITWETTLSSGENKEYRISYSVKYPKERKINL